MPNPDPITRPSERRRRERLIALAFVAFLAFNYPLVAIFARDQLLFGIPLLYLYLFSAWFVVIVLLARVLAPSDDEHGST